MQNFLNKSLKFFFSGKRKDPYSVLGITRNASKSEIKKAFIKLTREFHPDRNKKVTEAYKLLSSAKFNSQNVKTEEYEYTQDFENFKKMWTDNSKKNYEDIFSDFDNFFNSNKQYYTKKTRDTPTKGEDIQIDLKLTFLESVLGCEKQIQYLKKVSCKQCGGRGANMEQEQSICQSCNGSGYNTVKNGVFKIRQLCKQCEGDGKINDNQCEPCKGQGYSQFSESKLIYTPAGIQSGEDIKLKQEGNSSLNKGSPGDLILKVYVYSHDDFKREDLDIHKSILGCEKVIETIQGFQKVIIEPCTQHEHIYTLKGEGIRKDNIRGDHKVHISVQLPKNLTDKQKKIFEELRKLENNQFKFKWTNQYQLKVVFKHTYQWLQESIRKNQIEQDIIK